MRRSSVVLLFVFSAIAVADDAATKIDLSPKREMGQKERLVVAASAERTEKDGTKRYQSVETEIVRKIREIGDDGLPSKETLTFSKIKFEYDLGDGNRQKNEVGEKMTYPIERSAKTRRAVVEEGAPEIPDGISPQLMQAFRRDPDGLARILTPKNAVKEGDTWEPDAKKLLQLLGPKGAKLSEDEGSKAEAKLESIKPDDNQIPVAEVSLKATLIYATREDPDVTVKVRIEGTITGAADGSAAPKHEEITARTKTEDGVKETLTFEVDRKKVRKSAPAEEKDK